MWGALAGIGAHLIVAGVVLAVTFVAQSLVYIENEALFYTALGLAAVAGMAVAKTLGGRRAAVLFAIYCAIGMVMDPSQAWLEEERVRALGVCCAVTRSALAIALWQGLTAAGLVAGLAAARRAPTWIERERPTLEAAGAYALGALPVLFLFPVYDPRVAPFLVLQLADQWHIALVAFESAAAGVVLAIRRSASLSAGAGAVAVALIGLVTVAFADLSTLVHVPLHGWIYWPQSLVFVPLAGGGIALVILAIARGSRLIRS